jgi:TonB family protein
MHHRLRHVVAGLALVTALSAPLAGLQDQPVYQVGDPGVTAPRVTKEVRPAYSPDALRDRIHGDVVLRSVVSEKGVPTNIRVVKSLDERLDHEAVTALETWLFEAGRRNSDPVRVEVDVILSFRLRD